MTPRFLTFIPFIFEWETECHSDGSVRTEHDPDDPGGTTRYGIDARSHPNEDIENLTKERATEIYWEEWSEDGCDTMADNLGEVFFNAQVNAGRGRAKKLMDLSQGDVARFVAEQAEWYKRLVAHEPSMGKYLRGWLNRLDALRNFLGI